MGSREVHKVLLHWEGVRTMVRKIDAVLLYSQNAKKLAAFYRDVVGLKVTGEYEMGDMGEEAYAFEIKHSADFMVMDHSKVKGKNKMPERMMINFEVDDIKKEVAKLKRKKAKVIAPTYHIEGYGWVATFADTDGNYFQLVQVRPS